MKNKKKYIILMLFILIFTVLLMVFTKQKGQVVKVKEATCIENGYTIYKIKGKTQIKDIVPAKGHTFGEWEVIIEPQGVAKGTRIHKCEVCNYEESENYFVKTSLPRIMFKGDLTGIGKKDLVVVEATYSDDEQTFEGYATLKYQGHSSLRYDKKNFTVKFFMDRECQDKKEFKFSHWNSENKFILKANYIDVSRSRNLICADIWSEMVSTRKGVSARLQETSNNGAVDGFPTEVYLNDEFIGTYNLTLHKDDSLFDMDEGKKDGIVIINEGTSPEGLFKQSINWDESQDWEVEFCGTENDIWLKEKTNQFIDFVINSSDDEFKKNLKKYADVNSLIDYMIAMYSLGLNTSHAKDLILITYEEGPFIASLFDMENAFGMLADGSGFQTAKYGLPVKKADQWNSGTDSLLWDRMIKNYYSEIQKRYVELRGKVLNEESILKIAETKIQAIPEDVNKEDFEIYPNQPSQNISHYEQISDYTSERLKELDKIFEYK